jgi:hypothetical protein
VLVYDRAGRDIISPLLNVAQLRRNGITLHMLVRRRKSQTIGRLFTCSLMTYTALSSWILTGSLFPTCLRSTFADRLLTTSSVLPKTAGALQF